MGRLKKKPLSADFMEAAILNSETYKDYLARMRKICLSMFEWVNVPDSMSARYLEICLYEKGQAAILYDNDYGYINTQAADAGYINIYGLPTAINCYSFSYNTERDLYVDGSGAEKDKECILVMNNYERVPTASTINLFAYRLAEAQRTADVNIHAQRTPVLILTDKNQELSLKNLYAQYNDNSPVIYGDRNQLTTEAIKAIKTDAPFIAMNVMDYQREIWNQFLSFIGVSNLSEKRERMVTAETDSNNELVNLNMQSYLIPRKEACKQFNDKFGLVGDKALDVRVRSDLYNIVKEYDSIVGDYKDGLDEILALKDERSDNE